MKTKKILVALLAVVMCFSSLSFGISTVATEQSGEQALNYPSNDSRSDSSSLKIKGIFGKRL